MNQTDFLIDDILDISAENLESDDMPAARTIRLSARRRYERIDQRQHLEDVLKAPPEVGESIHVLSDSKFDFATWIPVMLDWKRADEEARQQTRAFAKQTAAMIREWSPTLPAGVVITTRPQGASWPGHYYAESLARAVAEMLNIPFVSMLARTSRKAHHGPLESLKQDGFTVTTTAPAAIVIDDAITSSNTMKLALDAVRETGTTAWGFAYNGS